MGDYTLYKRDVWKGSDGKLRTIDPIYDIIVRTQAEFNALIADSTWFGAVSIALIGAFTLSTANNSGVKIPSTVKQIHGYNGAKITITNFLYNATTAKGGLWYDTLPTTHDYEIIGLEIDCTGAGGMTARGFNNCTNLINCTGTATGSQGYGFNACSNMFNCKGTGIGQSSAGYGFYNCTNLTSCTGTGTGMGTGYGFYNPSYASACRAGSPASTTSTWGGTSLKVDADSCEGL
jgi:hypothetical protein